MESRAPGGIRLIIVIRLLRRQCADQEFRQVSTDRLGARTFVVAVFACAVGYFHASPIGDGEDFGDSRLGVPAQWIRNTTIQARRRSAQHAFIIHHSIRADCKSRASGLIGQIQVADELQSRTGILCKRHKRCRRFSLRN